MYAILSNPLHLRYNLDTIVHPHISCILCGNILNIVCIKWNPFKCDITNSHSYYYTILIIHILCTRQNTRNYSVLTYAHETLVVSYCTYVIEYVPLRECVYIPITTVLTVTGYFHCFVNSAEICWELRYPFNFWHLEWNRRNASKSVCYAI